MPRYQSPGGRSTWSCAPPRPEGAPLANSSRCPGLPTAWAPPAPGAGPGQLITPGHWPGRGRCRRRAPRGSRLSKRPAPKRSLAGGTSTSGYTPSSSRCW
ncbi:unnamed protein product [Gulo gulo]|uniref:Uncharacterized protein n=1 Tax=Gulo gulo TaxID=48420 RepID=A0A9X9Q3W5_GULGU|nr:unnamed protein product [Gulo gulo]